MSVIPPKSKLSSAPSRRISARSRRTVNSSRSSFATGASSLSTTSRKVGNSQDAQIYLDGVNVTPQSLLLRRVDPIRFSSSSVSFTSSRSQSRKRAKKTRAKTRQSHVLASIPSRQQSDRLSSKGSSADNENTSESSDESVAENTSKLEEPSTLLSDQEEESISLTPLPREVKAEMENSQLDAMSSLNPNKKPIQKLYTICFTETATDFLLQIPSVCVNPENASLQASVRQRNHRYQSICAGKKGSDAFVTGRSQTLQLAQKTKEVMTAPPATRDAASIANHWDIFDTNQEKSLEPELDLFTSKELDVLPIGTDATLKLQVKEIMEAMLASSACLLELEQDIIQVLERYQQQASKPKRSQQNHNSSRIHSRKQYSVADVRAVPILRKKSNASQNSQTIAFTAAQSVSTALTGECSGRSALNSQSGSMSAVSNIQSENESRSGDVRSPDHAYACANPNVDLGEIIATQKATQLMASKSLAKAVCVLERAVQQNVYHTQQVSYRNFPYVGPCVSIEHEASELEKLWVFHCDRTRDRIVTSFSWNTANHDLVAVGYKSSTGNESFHQNVCEEGLILFWTLTNPDYPERAYGLPIGVSTLDFSPSSPYLLAVGLINGVVAVYDVRSTDAFETMSSPQPIATSESLNGKHLDAVWQVKWVQKGSDRNETIVSISADGRVTEWNRKKGLNFTDLMAMKHVANPFLGSHSRAEGVISRQASGLSFDFMKNDPSVYFVGTEDGLIHKCSVSYNEQYLSTYLGHAGPVYRVATSPFCSDLFLSCSGDWSVKLWHHAETQPLAILQSVRSFAIKEISNES